MGVRPSEFWGVTWPLAAFYFDRGVRTWANYVDKIVRDAGTRMREGMRRNRNADQFANHAAQVAFNKIMGIDTKELYAAPPVKGGSKTRAKTPEERKALLDNINGYPVRSKA